MNGGTVRQGHTMSVEWYWWVLFLAVVALLMGADLGLFQRKAHELKIGEALQSTALRVALALLFCLGLYLGWIGDYGSAAHRSQASIEFLTAYIVEVALSVDNVFVFALVFRYFRVDAAYQHRILFWGILGALCMRAAMIFAGSPSSTAFIGSSISLPRSSSTAASR